MLGSWESSIPSERLLPVRVELNLDGQRAISDPSKPAPGCVVVCEAQCADWHVPYAHFFAGDYLKDTGAHDDADFGYIMATVNF